MFKQSKDARSVVGKLLREAQATSSVMDVYESWDGECNFIASVCREEEIVVIRYPVSKFAYTDAITDEDHGENYNAVQYDYQLKVMAISIAKECIPKTTTYITFHKFDKTRIAEFDMYVTPTVFCGYRQSVSAWKQLCKDIADGKIDGHECVDETSAVFSSWDPSKTITRNDVQEAIDALKTSNNVTLHSFKSTDRADYTFIKDTTSVDFAATSENCGASVDLPTEVRISNYVIKLVVEYESSLVPPLDNTEQRSKKQRAE